MKTILKLFPLIVIFALLPAACGSAAPPSLAAAGEPTLVFIYAND